MLAQQAFRFILVGVINTTVGYSLYALFIYLGLSYTYALGIATILGVMFNFQTIGRLVFKSRDGALMYKFIFVYCIVFCTNLGLINIIVRLGLSAYIAGALALLPATVISFVLNKYFVFKR